MVNFKARIFWGRAWKKQVKLYEKLKKLDVSNLRVILTCLRSVMNFAQPRTDPAVAESGDQNPKHTHTNLVLGSDATSL